MSSRVRTRFVPTIWFCPPVVTLLRPTLPEYIQAIIFKNKNHRHRREKHTGGICFTLSATTETQSEKSFFFVDLRCSAPRLPWISTIVIENILCKSHFFNSYREVHSTTHWCLVGPPFGRRQRRRSALVSRVLNIFWSGFVLRPRHEAYSRNLASFVHSSCLVGFCTVFNFRSPFMCCAGTTYRNGSSNRSTARVLPVN